MKPQPQKDAETRRHGDAETRTSLTVSDSPRLRVSPSPRLLQKAYTLIEVLAASSVVAVGMAAAMSLSSSLMIQEELTWRVAVVRNYQENMARVWQMGILSKDVMSFMPDQRNNDQLNRIINGNPSIINTGTVSPASLGSMEAAVATATVNISLEGDASIEQTGSTVSFVVYRPSLPISLRPPKP